MSIFRDFFIGIGKKRVVDGEEKFNKLNAEKQQVIIDKAAKLRGDALDRAIEKQPYLLPYIIGDLPSRQVHFEKLVDIATKSSVSIYDLVDKSSKISNKEIVNIAVKNQPELILELDDMPALQDLISIESFVEAFTKNPEVLFSNCKALKSRITINGTKKDGSKYVKTSSLKVQLQRAMNLYFRPEAYKGNNYDEFAKSVADKIKGSAFEKKVESNKMTTRLTTAANETLKKHLDKGRVMPAKALKNWNNRVLYTVPNVARRQTRKAEYRKEEYKKYSTYIVGLLKNSALNAFTEKERTRLAKRCVSICPEVYFELLKIEGFKKSAGELTVQLSAYMAFKERKDTAGSVKLLSMVDKERESKIKSRSKANETRKANKAKKLDDEKEKTL